MQSNAFRVFIGYDAREHDAWLVARDSLLAHSSIPLCVQPLDMPALIRAGLYQRSYRQTGTQKYDLLDGRPFSTDFSFSRFLVPALCQYQGWAMFVDCDFLFRADVAELVAHQRPGKAVLCVQHDHQPAESVKMDGQEQTRYERKNWSSLMLFNCAHDASLNLTPGRVSEERGEWLHSFRWCRTSEIGHLPAGWNWIAGHSSEEHPEAVHFTAGIPTMAGYEKTPYADEWRACLEGISIHERGQRHTA